MELQQTLQKRLDESKLKKESQLAQIKELNSRLQNKLKKLPRRPRETVKDLDERAKVLEQERTVTSISLAEERQILKQINGVKKAKTKVTEYKKMEDEVQFLKRQLTMLRDGLNDTLVGTDEIQTALEKVKLANKLECSTDEISETEIECPKSKLGMIIGKNGSMVKQIQGSFKVSVDIDSTDKIKITGSEDSVQRARKEIERIIETEEIEMTLDKLLFDYLTSKYVKILEQLREEYNNSYVDVTRNDRKLVIQGSPQDVKDIKEKIFSLQVVSKKRLLAGREGNIIVGKKGTTIERLCTEHMIPIDVSRDDDTETAATFVGPSESIDAALSDVEKLLQDNKEVEAVVNISPLKKDILLAEGGRLIKGIQAKVTKSIPDGNCYISVNKDVIAKDHPELVVKAKNLVVSDALQVAIDLLKELDELIVKCTIDPHVVPTIIGKGGETIKKLTEGKGSFLEVDKLSGEMSYGATSEEGLEYLRKQVEEILDNNCIVRIKADPAVLKRQYRELNRSKLKQEMNGVIRYDMDEVNSCYIMRGKKEDLEKAKIQLDEFIYSNQFAEIPITDEDREALVIGGRKSKIAQLSDETDVNLQIDRVNFCVTLRGEKKKVDVAAEKLSQFLNGGNGFSVMKFSLNDQVVGKVIGKGGKTRLQLEQKYNGVTINISRTHVVTIRGPSEVVTDCRTEIAKMVASARVTQNLSISEEQKIVLEKKDYVKKIVQQMPVNVTTTNDKIVVKGSFHDVRDSISLLNEMLTGEYKILIELDASQFNRVRNTARDLSHFERMKSSSGAKVELDLTAGSILITGKRSNVKRAKDQVYQFLDFILPNELNRLKITKPLYMSVGQPSALAEISAEAGGVAIYLDRDLSLVVIRSIDEKKVRKATELVREKIKEAERLACVVEISASDSWIIPVIIGKKGGNISVLRSKYPGCKIDISKESRTISIVGDSEQIVQDAREAVIIAIEKARSENVFISIPNTYIPSFLGKGGSNVKEISATHGVVIQSIKKGQNNFKISGETLKINSAKEAIDEWLDMREKANVTSQMTLKRQQDIVAILGQKGAVVRSIEDEFKCRIDVDKKSLIVKVKAPSEGQREDALMKIKVLVENYRSEKATRELAAEERNGDSAQSSTEDLANGIGPVLTESIHLSKNENSDSIAPRAGEDHQKSQFPIQPVGIAATSSKNGLSERKNVGGALDEGTEAGKSLFAMLTSQD